MLVALAVIKAVLSQKSLVGSRPVEGDRRFRQEKEVSTRATVSKTIQDMGWQLGRAPDGTAPSIGSTDPSDEEPAGSILRRGVSVGDLGEALVRRFLLERGFIILARNLRVGRGEIDIVVRKGPAVAVVEVRTLTGAAYPLDAIDGEKRRQVRKLAGAIGVTRCDLIGVALHPTHYVIHWDQGVP